MRERSSELGFTVWWALLGLTALAILIFGGIAIQRYAYPMWIGVQRDAVQESKSFVDSTNSNLANLKTEHLLLQTKIVESEKPESIAAYKAQQEMVISQMCIIAGTMEDSTVSQDIRSFLAEKGQC